MDLIDLKNTKYYQEHEKIFSLNKRVYDILKKAIKSGSIKLSEDEFKNVIIFHVLKAMKASQAIRLLCATGASEDALILLRSLYNLVINLAFIAVKPAKRTERFLDHHAIARKEYQDVILRWPQLFGTTKLTKESTQEIEADAVAVTKKHKFLPNEPWHKTTLLEMAKNVDKHSPYSLPVFEMGYDVAYRLGSDYEHTNAMAANSYLIDSNDKLSLEPSGGNCDRTLMTATEYLTLVLDLANQEFELGLDTDVANLVKDIEKIKLPTKSS